MKILCTICARGNSKGLKNKNIKKISGVPLLKYTIDHALQSNMFNEIVFSSDDKKMINLSKKFGITNTIIRPNYLASDKAGKLDSIKHAVKKIEKKLAVKFDVIVDLDVTSPLRTISDIKNAYKLFLKNNASSVISATLSKKNPYFNQVIQKKDGVKLVKASTKYYRRQDTPRVYDLNASIYIYRRNSLLNSNTIYTKGSLLYIMPAERSIDIDDINDFKYVEYLMKNKNEK